jgi:hypothetical protein
MAMTTRIDYFRTAPKAAQAMLQLQKYVNESGLEHSLLALVKVRASQINGWNRISIAFRTEAGSYRVPGRAARGAA